MENTVRDIIKFETVPDPVVDTLEAKLEDLLQIVAALVLTDEEVIRLKPDARPDNMRGWAAEMREGLLTTARLQLVKALKLNGFMTNTSAGFVTGPLLESAVNPRKLAAGYLYYEKMLLTYAEGEGAQVPNEELKDYWTARLRKKHSKVVVEYILRHDPSKMYIAALERMAR